MENYIKKVLANSSEEKQEGHLAKVQAMKLVNELKYQIGLQSSKIDAANLEVFTAETEFETAKLNYESVKYRQGTTLSLILNARNQMNIKETVVQSLRENVNDELTRLEELKKLNCELFGDVEK